MGGLSINIESDFLKKLGDKRVFSLKTNESIESSEAGVHFFQLKTC